MMKAELIQKPDLPDSGICFIMHQRREAPLFMEDCIRNLRAAYPDSPVLVIADGNYHSEGMFDVLRKYGVFVNPGKRLKQGLHHGAAIWTRFFRLGLMFGSDYLVKMDPDTRIHKRLTLFPTDTNCGAGSICAPDHPDQHIQGGFQLFPRAFAKLALAESQREEYKDPAFWASGQSYEFTNHGEISTDYTLSAIMRNLGSVMLPHPEMDCRSLVPKEPFREDAAVTHPHK